MITILIVEDDKNQCLLYRHELSEEGYSVEIARDGKEAVTMSKLNPPDLIVMDINMPGMDGIEAMGKILGENNKIPIVINTAYSSYKDNFMTWSADAYVVKSRTLWNLRKQLRPYWTRRKHLKKTESLKKLSGTMLSFRANPVPKRYGAKRVASDLRIGRTKKDVWYGGQTLHSSVVSLPKNDNCTGFSGGLKTSDV